MQRREVDVFVHVVPCGTCGCSCEEIRSMFSPAQSSHQSGKHISGCAVETLAITHWLQPTGAGNKKQYHDSSSELSLMHSAALY